MQEMSDLGKKGHKTKYPYLWACIYGVLLTGYALFTLLDAFVIPRDLVYFGETGQGMDAAGTGEPDGMTDMEDTERISINITTILQYDTQIYIADVTVSDVSSLRSGLAGGAEIAYEAEADAAELVENGAQQIFSFGPGLVREGEITVGEDSEVGQGKGKRRADTV